jgi:hypothetical protein
MSSPGQHAVPPEEQEPLYADIASELIALTPESWASVVLNVTVERSPNGVLGMTHVIDSLDGHRGPVIVSGELSDLTRQLLAIFQRHGTGWTALRFELRQRPDGDWGYDCQFTYP